MTIRPCLRGLLVLGAWLFVPGAGISAFVFWQSVPGGALFLVGWAAACALLALGRGASVRIVLEETELCVHSGLLLKVSRRFALRQLAAVDKLCTPLLGLVRCRVLMLHFTGAVALLPGLDAEDAQALCARLRQEV